MASFFDTVERARATCARLRRDFLWHSVAVAVHVARDIVVGGCIASCPSWSDQFRGRVARAKGDHVDVVSLRDGRIV